MDDLSADEGSDDHESQAALRVLCVACPTQKLLVMSAYKAPTSVRESVSSPCSRADFVA